MEKQEFNILLVDNDEMSLKSLSSFLASEGYSVFSFLNPNEALDSFSDQQYHIVITDYSMPGLNGVQLIEMIRDFDPRITTILYTGYATQSFEQEEALKRADHFFKKPLRIRKLIQILDNSIQKQIPEDK